MRNANGQEVSLLKEAVQRRDAPSVCYLVCFYDESVLWNVVIQSLPTDGKDFVDESLRAYERIFDEEECSW